MKGIKDGYCDFKLIRELIKYGYPFEDICIPKSNIEYYSEYREIDEDYISYVELLPLAVVQKWLREKKGVEVFVLPEFDSKTSKLNGYMVRVVTNVSTDGLSGFFAKHFQSYETALESGILKTLETL